jgi:hypothetical protein
MSFIVSLDILQSLLQKKEDYIMNQEIFKLNLEVEEVSLYLLCCGLADTGKSISFSDLLSVWNGDRKSMEKSIGTLEGLNILSVHGAEKKENTIYSINPLEKWKM